MLGSVELSVLTLLLVLAV
uniref:Uncharacterized protein n=1 Tax=Rhizophora mucronata TaxID=61149 RepID=A0A2P2NMJ5_RHIMU